MLAQLREQSAPLCAYCGEILKPGVTLFGELLPAGAMERATELARSARLLLVVGSSLEVWPVAGLPLEASAFAIVNRGPTALDEQALLKVDAGAGETLRALAAALRVTRRPEDRPVADRAERSRLRPGAAMTSGMSQTTNAPNETADTAKPAEKDFLTRLADAGEEAVQKLAELLPGGQRALTTFNDLRAKVDDLGKKVRGLEGLEARVAEL